MSRLVAHMVTRNEMGRWLPLTLPRLVAQFDAVVIYDDQSDDDTFEFARDAGCELVARRGPDTPSFAESESGCRQAAWEMMRDVADLADDDVVVAVDADEIVLGTPDDWHWQEPSFTYGHAVRIRELWALGEGTPLQRTDGHWHSIVGWRVAELATLPVAFTGGRGCGSVPEAWKKPGTAVSPVFCHLGYVHPADRADKHARHAADPGRHSRAHIASIIGGAQLAPLPDQISPVDAAWFQQAAVHARQESWGTLQ